MFGPGDGCTLWFDGWFGTSWRACCDVHDWAYSASMPELPTADPRLAADVDLFACVAQSGAWLAPVVAVLMFIGVRSVGWLFYRVKSKSESTDQN